jgi:hypothetical protein
LARLSIHYHFIYNLLPILIKNILLLTFVSLIYLYVKLLNRIIKRRIKSNYIDINLLLEIFYELNFSDFYKIIIFLIIVMENWKISSDFDKIDIITAFFIPIIFIILHV